jgi:hypothetical protein
MIVEETEALEVVEKSKTAKPQLRLKKITISNLHEQIEVASLLTWDFAGTCAGGCGVTLNGGSNNECCA